METHPCKKTAMADSLEDFQSQLRADPSNWDIRLHVADLLLDKGEADNASVLISMAPGEQHH